MKVDSSTWNKFRQFCRVKHRPQLAPSTIEETIRKLRFLERHGIDLINFDSEAVYSLFNKRLNAGATHSSINHYVKALNRWCKFRNLDIHFDQYREYPKPIRVLTTEEVRALINYYNGRDPVSRLKRMIIVALASTGMRVSELCGLRMERIYWKNREILVYGKGGGMQKSRTIPVSEQFLFGRNYPSLMNYVQHWRFKPLPGHEKYVFINPQGRQLTPQWVGKVVKEAGRALGIEWVHPHSFRHYYATNLLRNGVSIRTVQVILGHTDIKTTARYTHILNGDLHRAIRNFEDPVTYRKNRQSQKKGGSMQNPICKPKWARRDLLMILSVKFAGKHPFSGFACFSELEVPC